MSLKVDYRSQTIGQTSMGLNQNYRTPSTALPGKRLTKTAMNFYNEDQ